MTPSLETPSSLTQPTVPARQATRKHLRGSTLLLVGRIIAMATNFAVQVLIVRYLSKSDYGAFAYAMSLVSLGSSLAVFGMDKTVTRFLPIYQEKGEQSKLFGSLMLILTTILSVSFFLVLLVFGLRGWLTGAYLHDQQTVKILLLVILLVPVQAFDSVLVGMLAIFAKPGAIFFRRYILGPGLKLLVVLLLVFLGLNVYFLSIGFVISGTFGVTLYSAILLRELRNQDLWKHAGARKIQLPLKEIFGFSLPLLTANFVYMMRSQLVIVLLEYFHNTRDIADFRAVQPVADLNTVVMDSFSFLFLPTMARLFARKDEAGMDDLYWQGATWIAVMTFPIFLVTFSLAQPITLLFFGERYAGSGLIMALLALGYYFNAALGFNADTLRVHGRLRHTMVNDFLAMLICLGLSLALIPRYGAVGGALATSGTLISYNLLNHLGLKSATKINLFNLRYLKVYASIAFGALGLILVQHLASLPLFLDLLLAGLISLAVLLVNRDVLRIEQAFPELLRFPLIRFLFTINASKAEEPRP